MRKLLLYLTALIAFVAGSLATLELAAQTFNFSGPISVVTTTTNNLRAQAMLLVASDGTYVTGMSSGRLPVLADVNNPSAVTARNNAIVEGCVAPDADLSACNPVQIGGSGSTAVPSAMSADGDSVRAWLSRNGVLHVMSTAGTATKANVNDAATSTTLIAANTARLQAQCWNDSTSILYINFTDAASTTAAVEKVEPGGMWYLDPMVKFTGLITGIWSADASGAARCTELTQ